MDISSPSAQTPVFDPNQAEVVVVGAGPVGLWTSIVMKALDENLNVVVLDKYPEYKRDNPLLLERSSFKDLPQNKKVQELVDALFTKDGKSVSKVHINTNTIEEMFLQAAKDLGVQVQRGLENDVQSLESLNRFSNAKVVIGADGSKSQVRQALFGDLASSKDLQYIAQVKYNTKAPKPARTEKVEQVWHMKMARAYVTEVPKNPKEEQKTGTMHLLITVNKRIFEKIKDATFKNPSKLENCPEKLRNRALYWIRVRKDQDEASKDQVQVSSIRLNSYKSRDFVKLEKGKAYGLVGDAAFGVPYQNLS